MKDLTEYPEIAARFYDVVYSHLRSGTDSEFFLEEIARAQGKILEIGTGTGRFFVEALKNGADIYGLDLSRHMIEQLKKKIPPEQHSRLWIQNAVTIKLPHKFTLALAPFRMFSHLISVEDQIRCINGIWEHLEPGGRFIFDLFVPNLRFLLDGIHNQTDFDGEYEEGKRLRRVVSMNADLINQISHVQMDFIWDEQGIECQETWKFDIRFFFRFEIEHLIRISKFQLDAIYGDYKRNALNADSTDFVVVCSKCRG